MIDVCVLLRKLALAVGMASRGRVILSLAGIGFTSTVAAAGRSLVLRKYRFKT